MRIALMTNNYKPFLGGVPISVERLAKGLEALGHHVTVFAPTYQEKEEEENVFRYATWLNKFIGGIVLPNPFDRRIEEEFRQNRYDIIHVHHPMLIGRTAVYLSKKYGIPLTFTYHTRYEQYLSYIKGIRMLEEGARQAEQGFHKDKTKARIHEAQSQVLHMIRDKIVPAYLHTFLKHCDFVFAPTKGMREYLEDVCDIPYERIEVLPTGIEKHHFQVTEEQIQEVRKKHSTEKIPMFLSVSRMSHEKNVDFLLRSIARVKKKYQKPFKVLFIGDGPDKSEYERRCKELQIEGEVIFTGTIPNAVIAPYFAAADAFLFASKTETQGIVILEAFAGGTPVYALDATGVSDLVISGENGFLLPEDEEIYAAHILDNLTGKVNHKKLSENALRTAQEYREEAVAAKAVHLYNKVIALKNSESVKKKELRMATAK
uniref:glycosyltransferase n=1 Tax=Acetatifactor sp. TaxID=1872090 RepID=UPI004056A779